MDSFWQQFTEIVPSSYSFDLKDVLIVLGLSFVLSMIIGKTYSLTHTGVSYSQSFVQTLVMITIVVSGIMLIVGSNIARAFTLLGALSIVRFRNAIKDSRDVSFIFFSMAVGMACGTRFYPMAILLTFVSCGVMFLLVKTNFGARSEKQSFLRVVVPKDLDYKNSIHPILKTHAREHSLINMDSLSDELNELNIAVIHGKGMKEESLISDLRKANSGNLISLIHGDSSVEI